MSRWSAGKRVLVVTVSMGRVWTGPGDIKRPFVLTTDEVGKQVEGGTWMMCGLPFGGSDVVTSQTTRQSRRAST
jgi:hypothetical protein